MRWVFGKDGGGCRKADLGLTAFLFALGCLHWMWFFGFGAIRDDSHDWPRAFAYYDVIRQAVASLRIPFHTNVMFQGTSRFMAVPETLASPQILLLPFLENGTFALVQVLLLYCAGFAGTLHLRRTFAWSPVALIVFWLLFNFNGHITAHLAVGHMMWSGYFLLPLFVLLVHRAAREGAPDEPRWTAGLWLAVIMAAILLQGGLHLYVYCIFFAALAMLFNRRFVRAGITAIVGSGLLGSFRLAPAGISFWNHAHAFDSGYPDGWTLLEALVRIRPYNVPRTGGTLGVSFWWEYDLFIGLFALGFLLFFGVKHGFASQAGPRRESSWRALGWPVLAMAVLAMGDIYGLLGRLPLPLIDVERCASRFMILPFLVVLTAAVCAFSRKGKNWRGSSVGIAFALIAVTAWELYLHSHRWAVPHVQRNFPVITIRPAFMVSHADPVYRFVFFGGVLVSLLAAAGIAWRLRRTDSVDG